MCPSPTRVITARISRSHRARAERVESRHRRDRSAEIRGADPDQPHATHARPAWSDARPAGRAHRPALPTEESTRRCDTRRDAHAPLQTLPRANTSVIAKNTAAPIATRSSQGFVRIRTLASKLAQRVRRECRRDPSSHDEHQHDHAVDAEAQRHRRRRDRCDPERCRVHHAVRDGEHGDHDRIRSSAAGRCPTACGRARSQARAGRRRRERRRATPESRRR